MTKRVMSIFDVQEPTNQDRLAMIEIGARMVTTTRSPAPGSEYVRESTHRTVLDYAINPH